MVFMHIIFGLHLVIYFVVLHSKGTVFFFEYVIKKQSLLYLTI